ncbi:MAG TPA: hypothetical protein VFF70_13300 [Anaerolineae bacterium]|nr:hypothetical protein [Anaerolineae bacterium]
MLFALLFFDLGLLDQTCQIKIGYRWIVSEIGGGKLIRCARAVPPDVAIIDQLAAERHMIQTKVHAEMSSPGLKLIIEFAFRIQSIWG